MTNQLEKHNAESALEMLRTQIMNSKQYVKSENDIAKYNARLDGFNAILNYIYTLENLANQYLFQLRNTEGLTYIEYLEFRVNELAAIATNMRKECTRLRAQIEQGKEAFYEEQDKAYRRIKPLSELL